MTHVQFSWSDSIQATFSSCLPCLKSSDGPSDSEDEQQRPRNPAFAHAVPPPRARPDELEGLLADTSDDADALSLHTNPGERRRRKKRRRTPKHIRIFGYDLFGRAPAIQLPESDNEDPLVGRRRSGSGRGRAAGRGGMGGDGRTISSSSMDSDAAPLDAAAIEEMSAARQAQARAREEEERRQKEERKRRRRERKELKKAAMAAALDVQANGEQDFEGFQGSGPALPHLTSPFAPSLTSGTGSGSTSSHDFGPFAHGQPVQPFDPEAAEAAEADEAADGADFGGESYASRPRSKSKSKSLQGSGTMSTSDTRSSSSRGTSTVYVGAGPAPYNHQFQFQHQPILRSPLSESIPSSPISPTANGGVPGEKKKRRKSKSKTPASLSLSHSTSTGTASELMSPPPTVPEHLPAIAHGDSFEGFPGGFGSSELRAAEPEEQAETRKAEYLPVSGFPSVGLRGGFERRSSNNDMGV
ncbi:hypothetical protein OH76DRAFT_1408132, partial [Lentinus brumalis]